MRFLISILLTLLLSGCAGLRKEPTSPLGDKTPPSTTPTKAPMVSSDLPKVALILGPGGAKALAHAGVLKSFMENKIPVSRVVGLEWGALVGALFADKGRVHEVDWKLYKLEQVDLNRRSGFLGIKQDHSIQTLDTYFKDNLGKQSFENLQVEFSCPSRSFWTGTLIWQKKGSLAEGLKKCLPFPPLFNPSGSWLAAPTYLKEVIQSLKDEGHQVIVLVDVLGKSSPFPKEKLLEDPSQVILWQEVARALKNASGDVTDVITVNTEAFHLNRFDQRKNLALKGEEAGQSAARRLSAKYGY